MSSRSWEPLLVTALLGSILLFGVTLRLQDPLSTRALGAEDPYTHVVFIKEWIRQGYFADSTQLGTVMYPPGMHAWLSAFVPFTGISLYEFARLGPAFLASIGLLGLYALGSRIAGPAAGLSAAFLAAIMPEHIFRTELLFPTAFDLALIPLWLLGFHLAITTHRVEGSILFLGAAVPLALMHPWAIPLFGAPLALYAAVRFARGKIDRPSLLLAAGLVVPPTAFAMSYRWEESDTGFADFLAHLPGLGWLAEAHVSPPVLLVGLLLGLGAVALAVVTALSVVPRIKPRALRIGFALVMCIAGFTALPLVVRDPPRDVNFPVMLGPIVLFMGLFGFAVAWLWPSALGDLGLALSAVLFPLAAIDLFDSRFWPQRTVAYFAMGAVLMGAAACARVHSLAMARLRTDRSRAAAGSAALVALALLAAGSATAMPVNTYEWYRLYTDEQFHGFEEIAAILDKDEDSRVFVYTWQPALMIKTVTEPAHVWYGPKFFYDEAKRTKSLGEVHAAAYVLVDKFTTRAETQGKADLGFLEAAPYTLVYSTPDQVIRLYEVRE